MSIGSDSGDVSGDVTVPLEALGVPDPGVGATTISVDYDPDVLDATTLDPDPGGAFDLALCSEPDSDDVNPDTVKCTYISALGVSGDSVLANLTFNCVGQGTSSLDVIIETFTDPAGAPIAAVDQDGSITCGPTPTPAFVGPPAAWGRQLHSESV